MVVSIICDELPRRWKPTPPAESRENTLGPRTVCLCGAQELAAGDHSVWESELTWSLKVKTSPKFHSFHRDPFEAVQVDEHAS